MTSMETIVKPMTTDAVAGIVEQWRTQRPDLDASPMLVVGRIGRLAHVMDVALRPTFAEAGLGEGDFDVLAALRRTGPPYSRTPGELRDALMVTGGAVSKQVDRLVSKRLVTRKVAPEDARGRQITLTRAGVSLVDGLLETHLANERRLLAGLTPAQESQLAAALAVLAENIEADDG